MEIKTANACYVTDVHGNSYIDTTMGSGAQIIGHNNKLIKKISQQIEKGTIYTIPNCHTRQVNYYLKKYINPDFYEQYIFCNSGTEANMRAIRLARAFTGKSLIGRFHGGWHGGLDGFLDEHPDNKGVPQETNKLFKVLPYNDEQCFNMITEDMAAVIIEPVQGSNPRSDVKEFLQRLRQKCTVLGGGFPIGALGGKEQIMKTKGVFYGGTFSANPLSMYAASLILEAIIESKQIDYDKLQQAGEFFRNEINSFFISEGKKMRAIGCGPLSRIVFTDQFIKNRKERDYFETKNAQEDFTAKLKKIGVFVNGNGLYHFSMSHSPEVIKVLISKIKEAC